MYHTYNPLTTVVTICTITFNIKNSAFCTYWYSVRKSKTQVLSVIMLLIERHVSAYSEAIIRFNNCQLYETNMFHIADNC
jgi:hypothetical protein